MSQLNTIINFREVKQRNRQMVSPRIQNKKRKKRLKRKIRITLRFITFFAVLFLVLFLMFKSATFAMGLFTPNHTEASDIKHSKTEEEIVSKKKKGKKTENQSIKKEGSMTVSQTNMDTNIEISPSKQDKIMTTRQEGVYSINLDTPLHQVRFVSEEAIEIFLKDKAVLAGLGKTYYHAGGANQMPGELLAAIATHETGKGSSYISNNFNNLGGMICNSKAGVRIYNGCGKQPNGDNLWQKYNLKEESVYHKSQLLKSDFIDKGKVTIRQIWAKYAPEEADNDPKGLNKGWGPGVLKFFNEILAIQKELDQKKQ